MHAGGPEAVKQVLPLSLKDVQKDNVDVSRTYTNEFAKG